MGSSRACISSPTIPLKPIAAKALRVNLSDLAGKGATPLGFLLALVLPADVTAGWLEAFAAGLGADAIKYACPLIGGDTVRTPGPLTLSITALGAVPSGRLPARTDARPGDVVYVTGTIGDAALGLQLRLGRGPDLAPAASRASASSATCGPSRAWRSPPALAHAHAAMDVSDGLVGDFAKMLRASGVSGALDLRQLPLSPAARAYIAADARGYRDCGDRRRRL